jgi:hypothetical protein
MHLYSRKDRNLKTNAGGHECGLQPGVEGPKILDALGHLRPHGGHRDPALGNDRKRRVSIAVFNGATGAAGK